MKLIINESQFKKLLKEQNHLDFDMFGDDNDGYNEDNFGKFDPDYFEDSDEGFSSKMNQKIVDKKTKMDPHGLGNYPKSYNPGRKTYKDNVIPRDEFGKETKWSPIKKDEMSLSDYLKSPEHEKRQSKR